MQINKLYDAQKYKSGILTARTAKNNLKGTNERFLANDSVFAFSVILYDVPPIVKQLRRPEYFLTLSSADLRWDNLGPSDRKLKKH